MPLFKSTYNILTKYDEDEVFDPNWMDSDKLVLPPRADWDYKRELQVEDIDIWEVLYEATNGIGVYAAWLPYAEFYMITTGINYKNGARIYDQKTLTPYWDRHIETYYGSKAQQQVWQRCKDLGIPLQIHKTWVDDADMWLYQSKLVNKP